MKTVCVQGLGFVGAAMATAVALAIDDMGNPIYDVIGVDLPNDLGRQRVDSINKGEFPFKTSDQHIKSSMRRIFKQGNLKATTTPSIYSSADIIIVDIQFDISLSLIHI